MLGRQIWPTVIGKKTILNILAFFVIFQVVRIEPGIGPMIRVFEVIANLEGKGSLSTLCFDQ